MKVFILIWCNNLANANNSLLTFRTLRTGFPTAEVVVYDNASIIGDQVQRLCQETGAKYCRLNKEIRHHEYLKSILLNEPSAILVDPDIIFWEQVEHWDFSNYLIAGRLIPNFYDNYTRCHTVSRIHSSLMWLPDLKQLRARFADKTARYFDPITHQTAIVGSEWVFWDTLAGLYHLFKDQSHCFNDHELNAYDHLFCGTHLDLVINDIGADSIIAKGSRMAMADVASLKGYWRQQDEYFAANPSPFLDNLYELGLNQPKSRK
ncbi:hypothetical protein [Nitrosomonas sp.]|uniref:hypothetical protein n=1 Tax=Nitrosomonas sp. TaxID=42353 RepID=UPI0025DA5611|nr:hypothetical protein [Nitrosomonas sp.]